MGEHICCMYISGKMSMSGTDCHDLQMRKIFALQHASKEAAVQNLYHDLLISEPWSV
jgi:hypothetical protein